MQRLAAALDPRDHEGNVLDLDRDSDASLDEVALGVVLQERAEVGEDPRVGDQDVVVEPITVDVNAKAR